MTTTSEDHNASQPGGIGSSEGLGPLPEPDGWAIGGSYYPGSTTHMGRIRFGADAERYTADQVRDMLAAERGRWAQHIEAIAARRDADDPHARSLRWIAAELRA